VFQNNPDKDSLIVGKLADRFGIAVEKHEFITDMLCITVNSSVIYELLLFLRDDADMQYNFLTTLCGMHYPEKDQLGVVYHLHSFLNNHRLRIKTSIEVSNPVIPSVIEIWPSANWMERETYDFFGIIFGEHPNLVRILNVEDMTDFPMRKEFPLEDQTREDKNDSMFGR